MACREQVPAGLRKGLDSLTLLVSWSIWKARNRIIFHGRRCDPAATTQDIIAEVSAWIAAGNPDLALLLALL
jgi:hypothetical protein